MDWADTEEEKEEVSGVQRPRSFLQHILKQPHGEELKQLLRPLVLTSGSFSEDGWWNYKYLRKAGLTMRLT